MVTEDDIAAAAKLVRHRRMVAFPTETVYGLGANALDASAVLGIFELKRRPRFDPLIVHIANVKGLLPLVKHVPDAAAKLIQRFWPGPLSIVLPKRNHVPDIVTSGLPSVAVRCPAHAVARSLIEAAGVPIAAPIAVNVFYAVSPTTAGTSPNSLATDYQQSSMVVRATLVSNQPSFRFSINNPRCCGLAGSRSRISRTSFGRCAFETAAERDPADTTFSVAPGKFEPRHYSPTTPLVVTC